MSDHVALAQELVEALETRVACFTPHVRDALSRAAEKMLYTLSAGAAVCELLGGSKARRAFFEMVGDMSKAGAAACGAGKEVLQ